MKQITEQLRSNMCALFRKIAAEREHITIDGMPGLNDRAQFVGGKLINFCSYVVTEYLRGTSEYDRGVEDLKQVLQMAASLPMETWGSLNAIEGMYRLKEKGLLESVMSEEQIRQLREQLDWRTFVDEANGYALIHLPTNYYGVAFGIARYRNLLGWEEAKYSERLLDCLLAHIRDFSGEFGYMDETRGEGRFDRYSLLVPCEITSLILDTGWTEPQLIREMLDRSTHIFLAMANEAGTGVAYGRSIGAYGETAVLQTLSAAALLGGIYQVNEASAAHGYSCRILRRMMEFWYDADMHSINLWEKGRRTDNYRGKHRILGENLSLYMQLVGVMEQWCKAGYDWEAEPEGWMEALRVKPGDVTGTLFRFAKDTYDRCLAIIRDGSHVWSLPIINGGAGYFNKDAYLTVPRENLVLEAVPEAAHGAWVPQFLFKKEREHEKDKEFRQAESAFRFDVQGSENATSVHNKEEIILIPACYADHVELIEETDCVRMKIHYPKLCRMDRLEAVEGYELLTEFLFSHGEIQRTDRLTVRDGSAPVSAVQLSIETFSEDAVTVSDRAVQFQKGTITGIEIDGYSKMCAGEIIDDVVSVNRDDRVKKLDFKFSDSVKEDCYNTPHGPQEAICCWTTDVSDGRAVTVSWRITYNKQIDIVSDRQLQNAYKKIVK